MTATDTSSLPKRLEWQFARVCDIVAETRRVKSLVLQPVHWTGHLPGQHIDIRLTAEDGYQAQRSYSIASPPEDKLLMVTVERVEDGEVSPYLLDELRVGDSLELRGPIARHFVWTNGLSGPLCLIAGGTGITPLMAMLRHRDRSSRRTPAVLIYSTRSLADIVYREKLDAMARSDGNLHVVYTLTREQPRIGLAIAEELTGRCLWRTAFRPHKILRFTSAALRPSSRPFPAFLSSSGSTLSTSKQNASDHQEDEIMANNVSDLLLGGDAATRLVQQLFVPDVTLAKVRCEACDCVSGVGALTVYAGPMGAVLNCADCDNVLMRVVDTPQGLWLEMSGTRSLRF